MIDALTKVLVGLYEEPERPANAVDYIKRYMGAPAGVDVESLRVEVEQLRAENAKLQNLNKELGNKVSHTFHFYLYSSSNILLNSSPFLCIGKWLSVKLHIVQHHSIV